MNARVTQRHTGDPLPSWVEGPVKDAVLDVVRGADDEDSPRFVPVSDRVAAFDNDGTLWAEKPEPVQLRFLLGKLQDAVRNDPALADVEPYLALATGDRRFFGAVADQDPDAVGALLHAIGQAWAGASAEEFDAEVRRYFESERHERFGCRFTDLVYAPMRELIDLMHAHGWRVFVCSGGGRDFMRVIAEQSWGLHRERVIGSAPDHAYRDGQVVRVAAMSEPLALGPGKPEHLYSRTGQLPVFACGNGDVDVEMLQSSTFALVIDHDDPEREYAYTDGATRVLDAARTRGWTTVSMREDWSRVFTWDR